MCRSPLVERLLQPVLDRVFGIGGVGVRSAGTGALTGEPMDRRAAGVLLGLGGDSAGFVSRQLEPTMVANASLVLTATREHRATAVRMHPRALHRAFTVREFAALLRGASIERVPTDPVACLAALAEVAMSRKVHLAGQNPNNLDIVDPYRRPDDAYALMRAQIAPAIEIIGAALTPAR
ncbi:low molecular weight phosphatase family protein [Ornithinimicrobium faecis]|uniref:Low molecular weight phosphatase family protein n=1 Tax=Ornithinimicrobium faecis TaxID=2934158 RepID=A0ABY4YT84_9MICO|nr:low molecular weight phosphatase family protein [Ornithinimicrobium sp. HY1793]